MCLTAAAVCCGLFFLFGCLIFKFLFPSLAFSFFFFSKQRWFGAGLQNLLVVNTNTLMRYLSWQLHFSCTGVRLEAFTLKSESGGVCLFPCFVTNSISGQGHWKVTERLGSSKTCKQSVLLFFTSIASLSYKALSQVLVTVINFWLGFDISLEFQVNTLHITFHGAKAKIRFVSWVQNSVQTAVHDVHPSIR